MRSIRKLTGSLAVGVGAAFAFSAIVQAHHSFAMYDLQKTRVFTGVVTRVDPAPNHLQIFFAPMNDERKNVIRDDAGEPVVWSVEMQGSSQAAREGISVSSFPRGTIFSVGLHPLRNGDTAGAREGGIFKCPEGTPPAAGMHCDSVDGHVALGDEGLPSPKD
jgi:hypothetical protein